MPLLNCVLFTLCLVYKLQKGYIEQDKQVSVLSYPTYPELFSQLQAIYLQAIYLQSLYQLTVIRWYISGHSLCSYISIWTRRTESAYMKLCKQLEVKWERVSLSLQRRMSKEGDSRWRSGIVERAGENNWKGVDPAPERPKIPARVRLHAMLYIFSS